MPFYSVTAVNAQKGDAVKVEFFLGGRSRGFTSNRRGDKLTFEVKSTGSYEWYAKYHGKKVDSGRSSGGNITIMVS